MQHCTITGLETTCVNPNKTMPNLNHKRTHKLIKFYYAAPD